MFTADRDVVEIDPKTKQSKIRGRKVKKMFGPTNSGPITAFDANMYDLPYPSILLSAAATDGTIFLWADQKQFLGTINLPHANDVVENIRL